MTAPVIVPISPGEKPTEPGWYVADGRFAHHAGRHVIEVADLAGVLGKVELHAIVPGTLDPVWLSEFVFIARIYPERIEGNQNLHANKRLQGFLIPGRDGLIDPADDDGEWSITLSRDHTVVEVTGGQHVAQLQSLRTGQLGALTANGQRADVRVDDVEAIGHSVSVVYGHLSRPERIEGRTEG